MPGWICSAEADTTTGIGEGTEMPAVKYYRVTCEVEIDIDSVTHPSPSTQAMLPEHAITKACDMLRAAAPGIRIIGVSAREK